MRVLAFAAILLFGCGTPPSPRSSTPSPLAAYPETLERLAADERAAQSVLSAVSPSDADISIQGK
jgi:hypothetical protein